MMTFRTAAIFLMIPVAAFAANSEWGASLVVDMFHPQSVREELKNEEELSENLEVVNREIQRRIAIKEALVAELIAGRTTLAAVSDEFLALNRPRQEYMTIIRATYPGNTDEEKSAHNVIGYVTGELVRYPQATRDEVLARLQSELQTLPRTQKIATH
ncbi:MAG: hypothetical protein K8U57_12175 [Planctomycetes bacterium]|nr:hypothetical protein [Planctomycetota bacterium]